VLISRFPCGGIRVIVCLQDLLKKTVKILHPPKARPFGNQGASQAVKDAGYAKLLQMSDTSFAKWMKLNVKLLCQKLEEQHAFFTEAQEAREGIDMDAQMWAQIPDSAIRMECYQCILELFQSFLSWDRFNAETHRDTLHQCFAHVASRTHQDASALSYDEAVKESFSYFQKFAESSPTIAIQVAHLGLLSTISDHTLFGDDGIAYATCCTTIAAQCTAALKKVWTEDDTKPIRAPHLATILETLLRKGGDPLQAVTSIVDEGFVEIATEAEDRKQEDAKALKDLASASFPTLTKGTFHVRITSCSGRLALSILLFCAQPVAHAELLAPILAIDVPPRCTSSTCSPT